MLRLLLFCLIIDRVHGACTPPLTLVRDGQCRGKYNYYQVFLDDAVNQAVNYCQKDNAHPVAIHTDEQLSYWSARKTAYNFVLGLICNTTSKQWKWQDGTILDFKPPSGKYDPELEQDCTTGCSWFLESDGGWHRNCSHVNSPYTDMNCIMQLPHPVPSIDCGNFVDGEDDTHCYEIAAKAENWKDAQTICHSFGAELASIHSQEQNSYIRRLAVSRGAVNGVLLGGTISGKGDDFGWIDGTEWDYQNFYPSFPIDGLGACLSMDTVATAGQWMNTDCTAKLPVVCERSLNTNPNLECSGGPWTEGQIIYSPGFPDDASTPCDYFFTVATGKKVNVHIMVLEANSCCDRLVLTDGYIGGTVVANLTGDAVHDVWYHTTTSNTMRVSWLPNGGVNVRGVMMSFTVY